MNWLCRIQRVLHSICCTRILLNIRSTFSDGETRVWNPSSGVSDIDFGRNPNCTISASAWLLAYAYILVNTSTACSVYHPDCQVHWSAKLYLWLSRFSRGPALVPEYNDWRRTSTDRPPLAFLDVVMVLYLLESIVPIVWCTLFWYSMCPKSFHFLCRANWVTMTFSSCDSRRGRSSKNINPHHTTDRYQRRIIDSIF